MTNRVKLRKLKRFSIKISAKTKRQLQEMFRRRGKNRLYIDRTFAALLFILLKDYFKPGEVIIVDLEYDGHDRRLKDILAEMFGNKLPEVRFESVGDSSRAHGLANDVFKGKLAPGRVVSLGELSRLALGKAGKQKRPRSLD